MSDTRSASAEIPGYAKMLDDLATMLREIPLPPIFASSVLFPSDGAWKFTHERQDYLCASASWWASIPEAVKQQSDVLPLGGIEIVDIDDPRNRLLRAKVTTALVAALNSAPIPPKEQPA